MSSNAPWESFCLNFASPLIKKAKGLSELIKIEFVALYIAP